MKKSTFPKVICLLSIFISSLSAKGQNISTVAGSGVGDDSLATKAELSSPVGVATDKAGNTYIADSRGYRIRKIDASGIISTIAGNGNFGHTGDGGPATAASIDYDTYGIAVDNSGNVYFTEGYYNCIRKISTSGIITTIAGIGSAGYTGDGGAATDAELNNPTDLAVDAAGNIIVADWLNSVVRQVSPSGTITTIVGTGGTSGTGDGGPATASELGRPFRVTVDNKGNLYVAAVLFQCITQVDPSGIIHLIGGTGAYSIGPDGDGGPATAATMTSPCGIAVDTLGHLYFSDIGNNRIRMIDMNTGLISAFAANGTEGFGGDGGPATAAMIYIPEDLACDVYGNVMICDAENQRIRKVEFTTNIISTFAGQNGLFEEGYDGVSTKLLSPADIDADASGNVYITDEGNHRVRKLDAATGVITTVAGNGTSGYGSSSTGDGGPASAAPVLFPSAVALDASGNIYICDQSDQRIRKVTTDGIIHTIAGKGTVGFSGDGGLAVNASMHFPTGIVVNDKGEVFFVDNNNQRIRKINTSGIISTIAGNGTAGYSGDGGPAAAATINYASGMSIDGIGNLYVADGGNSRIRKIDTNGIITTVAGDGSFGYSGDGSLATNAQLAVPYSVKSDKVGNLYIADHGNNAVRMVSTDGTITTIAGSGTRGFDSDGGLAIDAMFNRPTGVAIDPLGDVFISDGGNNRIRKMNIPPINKVKRVNAPTVSVFPNPVTSTVTITNAVGCTLDLFDASGKELHHVTVSGNKTVMDMSSFTPGIFILQATGGNGSVSSTKITKL